MKGIVGRTTMENKVIHLDFIGKDYSPIENAVENVRVRVYDKEKDRVRNYDKEKDSWIQKFKPDWVKQILREFLEKIKTKEMIINTSKKPSKSNTTYKLWDPNYNNGYFCGLVGVLNGEINKDISDLFVDKYKFEGNDFVSQKIVCKIHLQIQSRLDVGEDKKTGKPFFLSTLLLNKSVNLNDNNVPNSEDELFDFLLLFWFKEQLQTAYLKGFYRTYRKFERNDDRLKGTIDFARHIRLNMGQNNGKIAYSYRENTVNNYLNHMIVMAYEHLKKKYYDIVMDNFDVIPELNAIIKGLKNEIGYSDFSSYTIISKNLKPIGHPYYTEYEELRKTCMMILRDEGISFFDGDSGESNGILAYLPDLWEEYLETNIMKKVHTLKDIKVESQKEESVFGIKTKKEGYEYNQKTYPDFVFSTQIENEEEEFMILDAKFKPKWASAIDDGNLSDILTDYDKCLRDMVDINGYATGVIFPINAENSPSDNYIQHPISEKNESVLFYTIPVHVPYSQESYSEWNEKMKENIGNSMQIVGEALKCEKDYYKNRREFEKLFKRELEKLFKKELLEVKESRILPFIRNEENTSK